MECGGNQTLYWHMILLNSIAYVTCGLFVLGCFNLKQATLPAHDTEDDPDSDSDVDAGNGDASVADTCGTCIDEACTNEINACSQEQSCRERHECLLGCDADDADCRIQCDVDKAVTDISIALDNCRSAHCQDLCDACGASIFDSRGAACTQCMQKGDRCTTTSNCAEELECGNRVRRRLSCKDPFCAVNDGLGYNSDLRLYESAARTDVELSLQECLVECRIGYNFDCYIAYTVPHDSTLKTGNTSVALRPKDLMQEYKLSGVKIDAWPNGDSETLIPVEEDPEGQGNYSLTVKGVYRGFFHLQAEEYIPLLLQSSRPFAGSETWQVPMTSRLVLGAFSLALNSTLGANIDIVENGMLIVVVFDCGQNLAPGIFVTYSLEKSDDHQLVRTSSTGVPIPNDEIAKTDGLGAVLYLNVPPGRGTIEFATEEGGPITGLMEVEVMKSTISFVTLFPTRRMMH